VDTTLCQQFRHIGIGEAIGEIPADRQRNDGVGAAVATEG
jgi:hypothetical protein